MNFQPPRPVRLLLFFLITLMLGGCISNPFRDEPSTGADRQEPQAPPPQRPAVVETIELEKPQAVQAPAPPMLVQAPIPIDLWERIRRGFLLPQADNPRVRKQLQWLRTHPMHLLWTSERASPYLYHIVEQAEQRGLPTELALLPAIESGFRPRARSPYGAAGLWQFMPGTAGAFGLKRTWWYDGRYDLTASTQAAFDYLQHLADQFEGDWLLTLAAYNAGPAQIRRAMERNRRLGLATDYWSLDLPRETQNYLPRLLAVARVVREPGAHGIRLAAIPNAANFSAVELERQIDLRLAARLAGVQADELKRLNPGLRRWATDPDGPHRLLVPEDRAQTLADSLAALPPEQWVSYKRYRIRRGDTLGGIAHKHGIAMREIQRANKLGGSLIRAGGDLLIPVPGTGAPTAAAPRTDQQTAAQSTHVVQRGDTLWGIARSYKLNHRQLAVWNGLAEKDTLKPGQVLKLRGQAGGEALLYRVRQGDSLYLIARRHGVTVADLKRWNELTGSHLRPGQELTLYPGARFTTAL